MIYSIYFSTFSLIFLTNNFVSGEVESRQYECSRKSLRSSKSDCHLRFGELSAINDNGCFMHYDSNRQESIELCPLQCQRFSEANILRTSDSLSCAPGVGVGVERRQSDWFMWRSGACRASDVIFELECSMMTSSEGNEIEIEENLSSSVEDISSSPSSPILEITTTTTKIVSTTTEKPEISENEDDLPEKVDTLLGFLFPSYRKKAH